MLLDGDIAIVTGGTSGIGKAIVARFLEEGATVVVADIDDERGGAVADELGCSFAHCDVTDFDTVVTVVEETVEEYGTLDVLVNDAGIASETSLEEMALDEWQQVIDVDLNGVMHGMKAALPYLEESEGCIVNIASIYGLVGGKGAASYSAAKGAVVNLTQQVAIDYAERGVRVNSICPGFVETPMTDELLNQDYFYNFLKENTPMNRPAKPEEIAPMAAFLASDEASYMTGANVPVDGGWTAH